MTIPPESKAEKLRQQQQKIMETQRKEEQEMLNILHGGGEQQRTFRARTLSSGDDVVTKNFDKRNTFSSQAGDLAVFNKLAVIGEQLPQSDTEVKHKAIGCAELESELFNKSKNDLRDQKDSFSIIRATKSSPNINELIPSTIVEPNASASSLNPLPLTLTNNTPVNLLSPTVMTARSVKGRGTTLGVLMSGQQKISLAGVCMFVCIMQYIRRCFCIIHFVFQFSFEKIHIICNFQIISYLFVVGEIQFTFSQEFNFAI